jgi:hypothetical protein
MRANPPFGGQTGVVSRIINSDAPILCGDGVARLCHWACDLSGRFASTARRVREPSPWRHTRGDANRGTQSAESPLVEERTVLRSVEAPTACGWEGPCDRAERAGKHARGRIGRRPWTPHAKASVRSEETRNLELPFGESHQG